MAIKIINRRMDIPIPERTIGYIGDNRVETRAFELGRMYGDVDLSTFDFKLDTEINGTKNIIDLDKSVTEDKITLTWTVRESHILHPGRMSFQIRAFSQGEEKWHSAVDYVIVQSSINATETQPDHLPSEFVQMEQRVTVAKNQAQAAAETAEQQADRAQGIADTFENTTLPAAIQSVEQAAEEQIGIAKGHADRAQELADTFEQTTLPAAITAVEAAGQAKVDLAEQQAERVEDIIREAEQDVLPELRQAIEDGIETKDQLGGSIQEAGEAKTALDGSISSAGTAKGELDGSITEAGVAKTQLDGSISSANGIKSQLDGSITAAGQAKELLDESIATGDLDSFKADYMQFKNDSTLKSAKIEKDLNDYKATLAGMNPNQEAKQKVNGYGIIPLPKNAANGQVSSRLLGQSATNLLGGKGDNSWTLPARPTSGIAPVFFDNLNLPQDKYLIFYELMQTVETFTLNSPYYNSTNLTKTDPDHKTKNNTVGRKVWKLDAPEVITKIGWWVYDTEIEVKVKNFMVVKATEEDWLLTEDELIQKYSFINGTKSTVSAMRIRIVSEDEAEGSTAYVLAKDEDGNIEELRSLPNGTKDEINVTDRKLIKRIGEKSNITNGMVIDFADMAEGGTYYAWNEDGETETGIKGDALGIDATTLIYQLAEPIEIPVQVCGTLLSYPSGTVYVENVVADAGLYSDGITVLHQDLPIKSIEKISKIDYETGLETILDASKAVIASDKLSFTHPDLKDGDIVFFTYYHAVEGTQPKIDVEYYDSRYTVKDSETEQFYRWKVSVANGVPSLEIEVV